MVTIVVNDTEYQLATTLRVAYKVQGMHNHEAYSTVFARIGDMPIEEQIGILYAALQVGNPTGSIPSLQVFIDYCLDNFTLKEIVEKIKQIVEGVMGTKLDETAEQDSSEGN